MLIRKEDLQRQGKKGREKSFICGLTCAIATMTGAELIQSQNSGAFSGFPKWVLESKGLQHPLLPSQAINLELDWKWGSLKMNWCQYWRPALAVGVLAC